MSIKKSSLHIPIKQAVIYAVPKKCAMRIVRQTCFKIPLGIPFLNNSRVICQQRNKRNIVICFVLPAVLTWAFAELLRKMGWIGENDLKLD